MQVYGLSGIMNAIAIPQTAQATPMMMNSYLQAAIDALICPIPYPIKPPSPIPIPCEAYHVPMTIGCWIRVNHMAVMATVG